MRHHIDHPEDVVTPEEWKPVQGFKGHYEVSSLGRLRSCTRALIYRDGRRGQLVGRLLKGSWHKSNGYVVVSFGSTKKALHRLVAEAFLEPPPSGFSETVNHINGDKLDNRAANLEWATFKRNNDHARDAGLCRQHAENCNLTKYGEQLVAAMKRVHARFSPTHKELSELFGMSKGHVGEILRGTSRRRG